MANDFTGDSNCVALWRLESGALTTDTIGSNTLTDVNTVSTETSDYQEGSACADLEQANNEAFSILDANIDSGFPFKVGDTTKNISFCGWIKPESAPIDGYIYSKGSVTTATHLALKTTNRLQFLIGYSSGAEALADSSTLTNGQWYHVGFTYENSTKAWKLRIWDDSDSSILDNLSGTATNNAVATSDALYLGRRGDGNTYSYDGLQDEFVVFKDILTTDEIDDIRNQVYGASGSTILPKKVNAGLINNTLTRQRLVA